MHVTAEIWLITIGVLVAVLHRDLTGTGQLVDVSMHAAANVTTEFASYGWLVLTTTRAPVRRARSTATGSAAAPHGDSGSRRRRWHSVHAMRGGRLRTSAPAR